MPIMIEIMKLNVRFFGNRYKSISPHIPLQKLTIAKARMIVMEICFKFILPLGLRKVEWYLKIILI